MFQEVTQTVCRTWGPENWNSDIQATLSVQCVTCKYSSSQGQQILVLRAQAFESSGFKTWRHHL